MSLKPLFIKADTGEVGLGVLGFKPYQIYVLEYLWSQEEGKKATSGDVYRHICGTDDKKSRASIIFFLNGLTEMELAHEFQYTESYPDGVDVYRPPLKWDEASGKGGYHRRYWIIYDRPTFINKAVLTILWKLKQELYATIPGDITKSPSEWAENWPEDTPT